MRPRRWVPRGRQSALGVVVDPELLGERGAQERVLGLVGPGDRVFRTPAGWLVRWVRPRVLREPYLGAPLIGVQPVSTAPLLPAEQGGAPPISALIAGDLVPLALTTPVDPADWLELSLPIVIGQPLRSPPPPPEPVVAPIELTRADFGLPPEEAAEPPEPSPPAPLEMEAAPEPEAPAEPEPEAAPASTAAPDGEPRPRRRRWPLVAALLVALLVFFAWSAPRPEPPPAIAPGTPPRAEAPAPAPVEAPAPAPVEAPAPIEQPAPPPAVRPQVARAPDFGDLWRPGAPGLLDLLEALAVTAIGAFGALALARRVGAHKPAPDAGPVSAGPPQPLPAAIPARGAADVAARPVTSSVPTGEAAPARVTPPRQRLARVAPVAAAFAAAAVAAVVAAAVIPHLDGPRAVAAGLIALAVPALVFAALVAATRRPRPAWLAPLSVAILALALLALLASVAPYTPPRIPWGVVAAIAFLLALAAAYRALPHGPGARPEAPRTKARPVPSAVPTAEAALARVAGHPPQRSAGAPVHVPPDGLEDLAQSRLHRLLTELERDLAGPGFRDALRRAVGLVEEPLVAPLLRLAREPSLPERAELKLDLRRAGGAPYGVRIDRENFEILERLRLRYQALAEQLEQGGEVDQAAFVWDELLDNPHQAVRVLERSGHWELAAKLAEVRALPAGLQVRLWWRAGDHVRAVAIARREQAWFDAVGRLEREDGPEAARDLRKLWAITLAAQGRWVGAVEVAKGDPALEPRVDRWIDQAIEEGGPAGAALLPRRLARAPHELGRLASVVQSWAGEPRQLEAALEALAVASGDACARLTRHALRLAGPNAQIHSDVLTRAARRHQLRVFAEDVPPSGPRGPVQLVVRGDRVGGAPILDAARTADGGWLVALGEAGVARLGPDGAPRAQLEWPTVAIVPNLGGNRFVLVGPGKQERSVAKLDLASGRPVLWAEPRVTAWSPVAPGDTWFVADGDRVLVIDLLAQKWRFQSASQVDGEVRALHEREDRLSASVGLGTVLRWQRQGFTPLPDEPRRHAGRCAFDGNGALVVWEPDRGFLAVDPSRAGALLVGRSDGLRHDSDGDHVELQGASSGGVRSDAVGWWIFDNLGRLVFVDKQRRHTVITVFP